MKDALSQVYDHWEEKMDNNEWYFSDAFDDIVKDMTPEDAFAYIPNVLGMLLRIEEEFLIWETLYFLLQVYAIADTTEIHPELKSSWDALEKHISCYPEAYGTPFQELKRDLRL
ncbi:ABC transporter [Metabacillus sp. GX 13764]|uniref:ABC transporter n=1 Tax=Metabacillus kandeliae TaxID=2900151 RepID=UPI001E3E5C05|nr:ABC transporter [Metabacillus kandeliae]MCD7034539.1 ABC transporter [Metabacillus kandeliae]